MPTRSHLILAAALAGLAATAAPAQQPPGTQPPGAQPPAPVQPAATIFAEPVALMIAACDGDGDARVSPAELANCLKRSYATIDTGGRGMMGYISFADWAERWLGDRNALPSPFEVDSNGDNQITLAELQLWFDRAFARFDKNRDAVLVRSELLTLDRGMARPRVDPNAPPPDGARRRR
ncbi:EF-hand domain-containing protein [Sphingomonas sp.]|uniref:EF-hand domain-containing protein n=1 Tax=Sphingomonas sp. TaxID=28214 RepID=UPI001D51FF1E|nr:EF-hand domain-containing protein [Sphingomonas sp.]MBX9795455.1 EF-hand domain-containing protein [Sphingomonas sp.]